MKEEEKGDSEMDRETVIKRFFSMTLKKEQM